MSHSGSFGHNPRKSYGTEAAMTVQQHKLGDRATDGKGEWLYIQANGAIAQYNAVIIDADSFDAEEVNTTNDGTTPLQVGFAQVALADNEQGWIWIGNGGGTGKGIKVNVAADYAAGAKLQTTATDGVLDDASTVVVENVVGLTTDGGSGSAVEVYAHGYMWVNA